MVLVLADGEVSQQMLALGEPVSQEQLSAAAESLTKLCAEKDCDAITSISVTLSALENDILKLVVDEMQRSTKLSTGEIYRDGLTHVLAEPEFGESDAARRALRIFEERSLLDDLLNRTVLSSEMGGVQVLIGGEGTWEELRDCSVVLARYGVPGLTGTLGVLGPMRMPYGHTISTVRFVAGLLSNMVEDMFAE